MEEMDKKLKITITGIGILVIFIAAPILSIHTQAIASKNPEEFNLLSGNIDMIIFISPQYTNDKDIMNSINTYTEAVKDDLSWDTKLIIIEKKNNNYKKIDQTIEQYYSLYDIKACIMVGEDIDTALAGDTDYMEKPSIIPWSTIGGESAYNVSELGVVLKPYKTSVCISLLYPTSELDYNKKKAQIINAFNKFSENRGNYNFQDILIFESSEIKENSKEIYHDLNKNQNSYYLEDPTYFDIQYSLNKSHSIYLVHGHSNPSGTDININNDGWFSADFTDNLDTPFFGADGCYVNGWWSNNLDNNILNPSIKSIWYGSKIFTSKNIRVMVLGLLSQNGYTYPVSFIENTMNDIIDGKTIAESMIGDIYVDSTIIIGDPTFYFNT